MINKKIIFSPLLTMIVGMSIAQTQTAHITQSGWYRIAINGPLAQGETGGNRAAARFIVRDISSSLHQAVEFLAYIHYGKKPSLVVLNNSYYRSGTPPLWKIRIVEGGTYEGAAVEIYVNVLNANNEAFYLLDNDQVSGWTAVNWQQVSTSSGDQDGIPTGFTARVINLQDIVNGFVTDQGQQYSKYNGSFYTSGNILLGKTSQTNPAYKLDVNGNIRANKVVVNTTGADYVFDSAYNLLSLDSLNNYIWQHRHLPGIPNAADMQKNGMDVGEAYTKLLEKMEVMTRYMIEQEKEITELKKMMDISKPTDKKNLKP